MNPFEDEDANFSALVNDEGQYSLWPEFIEVPAGWSVVSKGKHSECLRWIEDHWTDMRPLSLVREMEKDVKERSEGFQERLRRSDVHPNGCCRGESTMDDLVERLSKEWSPVEISLRPKPTVEAFKEAIERGLVLVKFTSTKGGTELGVHLDATRSDTWPCDGAGAGSLRLVGTLTLNDVPVRCVTDINLQSLRGEGRLEIVER
jgi:uncharacterized protein YbdZ (MbtH family)